MRRLRLLPDNPELGWTPYAWLIYTFSFWFAAGLTRETRGEWAASILAFLVFLYLYFRAYWQKKDQGIVACAAAIVLLGVLLAPVNVGSGVFFVYAAAFMGHLSTVRRAVRGMLAVVAVLAAVTVAWDLPLWYWLPAGVFSLLVGGINVHYREVGRANAKLRMAQEEVEHLAKTAERERIARDLHDLLGHTLSLITLKAELAGKLVERDPERAGREIREVERISREALREVRTAVAGYRSEGVPAELARARLALEAAGVKLEYFAAPAQLEPAQETVLTLALREAVTNVIRHAGAATCRITLEQSAGETRLEVHDDGRGGAAPEGIGLASMRERVEGLGGRLERRLGTGTSLLVTVPRRPAPPSPGEEGEELREETA
ncbi:MAG TPA: sensor histidine kinase [Thermoanaerobaculia bacterium]|nr:sensor histidine kinase [Thermoanaerobaculia bacterium]